MQIQKGCLVSVRFTMYSMDGDVLGSTEGQPPLRYIHGEMDIEPPGLIHYLSNKERGHKGELTLEPEEAYGPAILSPEKSMDTVSLDDFPADYPIEVGAMFMASVNKGDSEDMLEIPMTIMDIREDHALVFYGHPLAGQKLRFEIEIEDVRLATDMDRKILQDGLNPPTA